MLFLVLQANYFEKISLILKTTKTDGVNTTLRFDVERTLNCPKSSGILTCRRRDVMSYACHLVPFTL